MPEEYEIRTIPINVRRWRLAVTLIVTFGISGLVLWSVVSQGYLGWSTVGIVPFVFTGLWMSYHYWTTKEKKVSKKVARTMDVNSHLSLSEKIWVYGVNIIGGILALTGVGIFAVQVFVYLKSGEWPELPLKVLVALTPSDYQTWIDNPNDWVGVHSILNKMLEFFPLSLTSLIIGIFLISYEIADDT